MAENKVRDLFFNAIANKLSQVRETNFNFRVQNNGQDLLYENLKNYILQIEAVKSVSLESDARNKREQ